MLNTLRSDQRDPCGIYRSELFKCRLNATIAKVQKDRTGRENFIGGRRNIFRVRRSSLHLRRRMDRRGGTLFPSIASRLAINNVLFILPAAEIEWRVARAGEVVDRGVLWKRKGTPDRRHYLPKLGSDATISAQRLHKERSEVCHC